QMKHPTLQCVELDGVKGIYIEPLGPETLYELFLPEWCKVNEWIKVNEATYTFEKENNYISEWLVAARRRMPELREVKMQLPLSGWSLDTRVLSMDEWDGKCRYRTLEEIFSRNLRVEA